MVQGPLDEQFNLAIQNKVYEVAGRLNKVVEGVFDAVDDVLKKVETNPVYNITIDPEYPDPEAMAQKIVDELRKRGTVREKTVPTEPGGSVREKGTPLSREELLREVYRYVAKHSENYTDWTREYEDNNATATGSEVWIVNHLVAEFFRLIKEDG